MKRTTTSIQADEVAVLFIVVSTAVFYKCDHLFGVNQKEHRYRFLSAALRINNFYASHAAIASRISLEKAST